MKLYTAYVSFWKSETSKVAEVSETQSCLSRLILSLNFESETVEKMDTSEFKWTIEDTI
jgi:hypothetical protein